MSPRYLLLVVGGLAVIAAGIYLVIEVRTPPAAARVTATDREDSEAPSSARPTKELRRPDPEAAPGSATRPVKPAERPATGSTSASAGDTPSLGSGSAEPMDLRKLQQVLADAYSAYDRQDFEEAKTMAAKVLEHDTKNIRALRIMVSTSCIEGSAGDAQKYFDMLPTEGQDRADMRKRCGRDYNIQFR